MYGQKMKPVFRCWKCNEILVKAINNRGLIKSQVTFFEGDQLIARCKRCGENNVLPITMNKTQFSQPKLTIPVSKNNLRKSVAKKTILSYNNISSGEKLIDKDRNSRKSKGPGK